MNIMHKNAKIDEKSEREHMHDEKKGDEWSDVINLNTYHTESSINIDLSK